MPPSPQGSGGLSLEYEAATEDMMRKTSPKWAPWYLIPANDKLFGRLAAFIDID
jgi:polyphosphate kinase 2 (PPK2 family)